MCIRGCTFSLASVFVFSSPVLRVPPTLHCLLIWLHAGLHLVLKEIAVTCRWLWNPSTVPCTADLTCLRYQHLLLLSKQRFYDVSMCIRVREIAGSNKYFSDVPGRRLKKNNKNASTSERKEFISEAWSLFFVLMMFEWRQPSQSEALTIRYTMLICFLRLAVNQSITWQQFNALRHTWWLIDLLKFKLMVRMGNKGDVGDFEHAERGC